MRMRCAFLVIICIDSVSGYNGLVVDSCGSPVPIDTNSMDHVRSMTHSVVGCQINTRMTVMNMNDVGLSDHTQKYGFSMKIVYTKTDERHWRNLALHTERATANRYYTMNRPIEFDVNWRLDSNSSSYYVRGMIIDLASTDDDIVGYCANKTSGTYPDQYRHWDNYNTLIHTPITCQERDTVDVYLFFIFIGALGTVLIAYSINTIKLLYSRLK